MLLHCVLYKVENQQHTSLVKKNIVKRNRTKSNSLTIDFCVIPGKQEKYETIVALYAK
jgi:hypothetical protein